MILTKGVDLLEVQVEKKNNLKTDIQAAICALMNTEGGRIVVKIGEGCTVNFRTFEQNIRELLCVSNVLKYVSLNYRLPEIILNVKKSEKLVTVNYNMCLPTQTEVVQLCENDPRQNIIDIIERKFVENTVDKQNHIKQFVQNEKALCHESEITQFKKFESKRKQHLLKKGTITS